MPYIKDASANVNIFLSSYISGSAIGMSWVNAACDYYFNYRAVIALSYYYTDVQNAQVIKCPMKIDPITNGQINFLPNLKLAA